MRVCYPLLACKQAVAWQVVFVSLATWWQVAGLPLAQHSLVYSPVFFEQKVACLQVAFVYFADVVVRYLPLVFEQKAACFQAAFAYFVDAVPY